MMKHIFMTVILSIAVISFGYSQTSNLTIIVEGAENDKGKIFMALSPDEADYKKKDDAFKEAEVSIANGKATHTFSLPAGTYAVKVFHDENNNGELDTNFIGIPKEGVGFSNNPSLMGMPSFDKVSFQLNGDKTVKIELK